MVDLPGITKVQTVEVEFTPDCRKLFNQADW